MQCESCGEYEANVHLTHVVNGVSREIHMCEGCASKNGININGAMSLTDILVGLGAIEETAESVGGKVCPFCRMSLGELRRGSRMGCSVCYETFGAELTSMLADMQNGTNHVGKTPGAVVTIPVIKSVRAEPLGRQLEEAVAREDFETAARLRDEIRSVKQTAEQEKAV
ncbi:MAG: UvrB/UvrC motif-containing protein [bacterium]